MHKKQKIKKFLTACIATIYSLTSLISITPVHAESYTATIGKTGYSAYRNFSIHDRFSDTWDKPGMYDISDFRINGQKAYCVEPDVQISTNPMYAHEKIPGRSAFHKIGFSDSQIDRMAYISSLGYGFNGDNSKEMLAATQLMIWQVKKPNGFSQIPSAVQAKVNIINDRLNTIYKNVSFANNTVEIEGYGEEYAVILDDSSGTFKNYLNNTIPTGIHIERSGNTLKIWADKSAAETGNLVFDAFYLQSQATNTEIAYYQPLNQTLAVFGKKDPKVMRVSYKILVQPETAEVSSSKKGIGKVDVKLNMHKTDKDSKKGIEGIEFEFFRDDVSLGKDRTDENGNVSIPSHIEQEFTSDTFKETYVTNWDELSERMQNECISKGWFSNQSDAQASADKKAQAHLDQLINAYQNEKHVYKAVETDSGYYYYLDPETTVSVEYTGSGEVNMGKENQRYTLSIDLQKTDDDLDPSNNGLTEEEFEDFMKKPEPEKLAQKRDINKNTQGEATLSGAVYGLYAAVDIYNPENESKILYHAGEKIMEITTDENGYADTSSYVDKNGKQGLYIGSEYDEDCWYYFKEIKAPEGYELNELYYPVLNKDITQGNEPHHITISVHTSDKVRTGKFEIAKFITDGENSEIVKPEVNAEFKTVLKKYYDMFKGDMDKAIAYAKENGTEKEYAIIKTDDTGTAYSPALAYGQYVIIQSKKGDNGQETDILADSFTFIVSETSDGQTLVYGEDEHGNHISSSSDGNVHFYINNRPFNSYVQLVKKDKETQKIVTLNYTTFKIQMLDDEGNPVKNYDKKTIRTDENGYISMKVGSTWYSSFTTNTENRISVMDNIKQFFSSDKTYEEDKDYDQGKVKLPVPLPSGKYNITEINAPKDYAINNESVSFEVKSGHVAGVDPDGEPLIEIEVFNNSVKGQITVSKSGEVLTSIKKDDEGNIQFIYEDAFLAGATYNIYANEDILDPADGSVLFKKDTLMDTVTTSEEGKAISKKLPLGKYYVIEKKAPNGFIINEEKHEVELIYKDQNTEVVFDETSFHNERQKIALNILKEDSETHTALAGAVFGLYAKNDIKDNNGNILVKANELVERSTSNEDGKLIFKADLPLDQYYVKEIKAPIGYASTDEVFEFDGSYQGQDVHTIIYNKTFENKIIKVEVSKKDITNDEEIAGAFLTVYPKDDEGAIFDSWISGQDGVNEDGTIKPHMIKGLEVGKTYILKEISSPHGFALAQDVEFTIGDTGEIQKVEMKDELVVGQLKWRKSGEIFNQVVTGQTEFGKTESPVWNKSNLLGAQITIYAAEDIKIGNHTYYKADEKIQTLESDWDYVFSKELPVGRYYYKETTTPHGYVIDTNKHFFEIEDNQINEIQITESTLKNERPTFDIDMTKVLEEQVIFKDEDAYKDIVFGIFAREDIYDYMGNVAIEHGTMISTTGITKEGHLETVPDLPNGVYFIKELATNDQYVLNDIEYDFEIGYKGQDVSHYVVTIGLDGKVPNELARGDIYVQKKDSSDPDKVMKDVEFNISIHEDMSEVVQLSKTDEKGIANFKDLELGTYFIQEAKQVDGYVINDHIYKVEVKQDGDVLTIVCENKPTEMEFSKVDITTGKELPGAKMQVTDKETGKIIDEWVSTDEPHKIKYLVEGKEYILTEKIAPKGYELAESITFTAKDGTKITMKDKLIPEIPQTGDQTNLGLWLGLSGISILAVMALLARKRKKDDSDEE